MGIAKNIIDDAATLRDAAGIDEKAGSYPWDVAA
jgi:hypothetical protein